MASPSHRSWCAMNWHPRYAGRYCNCGANDQPKPQHLTELDHANANRLARAHMKRKVAAMPRVRGLAELADIIDANGEATRTLTVEAALRWADRVGVQLAARMLNELQPWGLSGFTTIGELTARQRAELRRVLVP